VTNVTMEDFLLHVLVNRKVKEMEVKQLKETIADQLLEIKQLKKDFALEKKGLLELNQEALEIYTKTEKEKMSLKNQMETAQKAHNGKATALESANTELKASNQHLDMEIKTLKAALEVAWREKQVMENSVQPATDQALRKELQNVRKELQAAKDTDTELRSQIVAATGNMNDILRAEGHYVNQMQQISGSIEDWVAKHVKSNKRMEKEGGFLPALSKDLEDKIISKIGLLGIHGRKSAVRLKLTFSDYFKEGILRIALVRHIIALYLFHEVLDSFAFGLRRIESELLMKLEDLISESQGNIPIE
jgi:chromosome segregation ATPase